MPPKPAKPPARLSLEALITSPSGFGLTTATPLQRAIFRIADGTPLGELAEHPHVQHGLGYASNSDTLPLPAGAPRELMILSGIRTYKSGCAAAVAVHATQTVIIPSFVKPGEIPRVSVVSLDKDKAKVVYDHIYGALMNSPALKALLVEEPKADSIILRHPSGRSIEIKVVPLDRAGGSLVARWSAGCILDEAPRMQGAADGVLNYEDARRAVLARLLPGAMLLSIGSPWAPFGPIYERVQNFWGKPTNDLVIIKAPGPMMNPLWWTPAQCKAQEGDPAVYRTDVLGEFADPEASLFTQDMLAACTRKAPLVLPPEDRWEYVAAMDPATRANAWTLVVATRNQGKRIVALAHEWRAGKGGNLKPIEVFKEMAVILHKYRLDMVITDQWAADALRDSAETYGLRLAERTIDPTTKLHMFENLKTLMLEGKVELPPDPQLHQDLICLKKRVTQAGLQIVLPRSQGRHADYAPALALAMERYVDDPKPLGPEPGTVEDERAQAQARKRAVFEKTKARLESEGGEPWWEQKPAEWLT